MRVDPSDSVASYRLWAPGDRMGRMLSTVAAEGTALAIIVVTDMLPSSAGRHILERTVGEVGKVTRCVDLRLVGCRQVQRQH
jgi:hypothetical protein